MFVLGLTGPTGAGKGLASKYLEQSGFVVLDADKYARRAVEKGSECLEGLAAEFGRDILLADGSLDRRRLARLAFSNPALHERLNALTHPYIMALIRAELRELQARGVAKVALDAPALFEAGAEVLCDKVAVVTAPLEVRIRRIMARDGITREEARERAGSQPPEAFYKQRADFVVENTGDPLNLELQVKALLKRLNI